MYLQAKGPVTVHLIKDQVLILLSLNDSVLRVNSLWLNALYRVPFDNFWFENVKKFSKIR